MTSSQTAAYPVSRLFAQVDANLGISPAAALAIPAAHGGLRRWDVLVLTLIGGSSDHATLHHISSRTKGA
ncbi:MAG: hypothetical protein SF162_13670 [bacterium]|nr:hypothetical protein [bacterium]